jgi:transposase
LSDKAGEVKGSRFAILRNPENLTDSQQAKLEMLATENTELYRAYIYKERLRLPLKLEPGDAAVELESWLSGACRSCISEIVELSKKIRRHKARIIDTMASGLSSARMEAINNKIKGHPSRPVTVFATPITSSLW